MFTVIGLLLALVGVGAVAVYLWVRRMNAWAEAMIGAFGLMTLRDHRELLNDDRNRKEAFSSNPRGVPARSAESLSVAG